LEIHLIFYFLISVISLALGLLIYKNQNKSLLFFTTLLLIMPTSDQFMFLTSFKGIYFYDYYFLIISVYYLQNTSVKFLKELFLENKFLISFLFLFIIYQTSLVYIDNIQFNKYLLKDFRPFILFFSIFIFINTIKNINISINKILNVVSFTFIIKIIFFIIIFLINPLEDPYYQNNLFRYKDGTTYVAALLLLIYLFKKTTLLKYVSKYYLNLLIILSIIIVLIANLRILLPAILFAYLFIYKTNSKNAIIKVACTILYVGAFTGSSYFLPKIQYSLHGKEKIELRIKNLEERKLSTKRINQEKKILEKGYQAKRYNSLNKISQQLKTRFFPAMKYLNKLNPKSIIIGNGMGTTFKIPSFSYRGLDPNLNKIDSFYLTQFIKYGFTGLLLILLLFKNCIYNYINDNRLKLSIISFYLIIMLVNSIFYQPGAIVHLALLNLIMFSVNRKNIKE
jgi:hypothetical protein